MPDNLTRNIGVLGQVVRVSKMYTATATDDVIVAVPAGHRMVLTQLVITTTVATVYVGVEIGAVVVIRSHVGVPAGCVPMGAGSGPIAVGTNGGDLKATIGGTTGTVEVTATYYLVPDEF